MSESVQVPFSEEIITDRCKLRIISENDTPYVWSATQHAGFNDGLRWDAPKHPSELKKPYHRSLEDWKAGTAYNWTIQDTHSSEFLGRIVLKKHESEGNWSVGFWIHPIFQRNGFATEAARAIVYFAFQRLDARNIFSAHAHWNRASQRVLEKLGMKKLGSNPCGLMKNGECIAECVYGISFEMWRRGDGAHLDMHLSMGKMTMDVET